MKAFAVEEGARVDIRQHQDRAYTHLSLQVLNCQTKKVQCTHHMYKISSIAK